MSSLTLVSYNVRFASEDDPQPWSRRRGPMIELLSDDAPHVLGLQEGLDHQLAELWAGLGDHLALIAEHRGDGGHEENSALLYDTRVLTLLDVRHRWLSQTPDVPGSRSWGTQFPRMFTRARFRTADGARLTVITTHLDHEVALARANGARQLASEAALADVHEPVVVMGDFNADVGSEPYRLLIEAGLRDAVEVARSRGSVTGTFTDYRPPLPGGERIDWILVNDQVRVRSARVVDVAPGGQYPSDHLPVEAVVDLSR